jgi:organic hydroperoxide reductase OsmC/OhrA
MPKFPLHFEITASTEPGISTKWDSAANGLPNITCSIPAEFSGPGGAYSPEDLFGLALLNCLIGTFKVYCQKSNLSFTKLDAKSTIKMDIDATTNKMHISEIHTDFNIEGASNAEKVKAVLDKSIADCAISNSIKSGKNFSINVI